MSSFSDNFTRDENSNTQYDDSAFFTFLTTFLLIGLGALIYCIIKRLWVAKKFSEKKFKNCECNSCKNRLEKHYKAIKAKNFNYTFYLMIILVFVLAYLCYVNYFHILENTNKFKTFNPHEILEVSPEATDKEIKKAYRKLTLKYHPDKNPNNLQAKAKFIMIAKAYEALTDETAKKNYELYGNPDGPGSMRLAVGLPSFVLNKKNHMPILVIFLLLIVVILPVFVWFWFSDSNKYDESGMQIENGKLFYLYLNENILPKQMPFIFGVVTEFSNMKVREEEKKELDKMWKASKDLMPKFKEETVNFSNKKAICLLYAYLNNQVIESESLRNDLDKILVQLPELIDQMYRWVYKLTVTYYYNPKTVKHFGLNCLNVIIEFSQAIYQKLSLTKDSSAFLQLPCFNENRLKSLLKIKGDPFNSKKFQNFLSLGAEEKKELLKNEFNEEEVKDIVKSSESIPVYELKCEVFVDGFEEILVNDVITIKITINRKNLNNGEKVGVSHSINFPELFKETVAVLFVHRNNTVGYEKIVEIDKRQATFDFKEFARMEGRYESKIVLMSLNYKGLETSTPIVFNVVKSSDKRTAFIKSIEKREIKKLEPSMFQQMLSSMLSLPNQDEEEEEDDEQEKEESDKDNKTSINDNAESGENRLENEM